MPNNAPFDAPQRDGDNVVLDVAASTHIHPGVLVARDNSGNAVPASDTANLVVVGRAQEEADNSGGSAGDRTVRVRRGVFRYTNSAGNALTKADRNTHCYVEDDTIVASAGGTNSIVAGEVAEVDDDGVWVDTRKAGELQQIEALQP